jgi:hypothetical protein
MHMWWREVLTGQRAELEYVNRMVFPPESMPPSPRWWDLRFRFLRWRYHRILRRFGLPRRSRPRRP